MGCKWGLCDLARSRGRRPRASRRAERGLHSSFCLCLINHHQVIQTSFTITQRCLRRRLSFLFSGTAELGGGGGGGGLVHCNMATQNTQNFLEQYLLPRAYWYFWDMKHDNIHHNHSHIHSDDHSHNHNKYGICMSLLVNFLRIQVKCCFCWCCCNRNHGNNNHRNYHNRNYDYNKNNKRTRNLLEQLITPLGNTHFYSLCYWWHH